MQAAVDAKHHLIATIEVTQDANDQNLLDPIAQQAKADLQLPADAPLKVLADTGYGTGPQHLACEDHGTIALAPAHKTDTNGLYNNDRFTRDSATDSYTCPQGKTLPRKADTKSRHSPEGYHTYHNAAACRGCPARAQCTRSPHRKLLISIHHAVMVRSRERLAADPAAMRTRASLVEHPFSTIKDRHGYTGLLCRGMNQTRRRGNEPECLGLQLHPRRQPRGAGYAARSHSESERATTHLKREGNAPMKPPGSHLSALVPRQKSSQRPAPWKNRVSKPKSRLANSDMLD